MVLTYNFIHPQFPHYVLDVYIFFPHAGDRHPRISGTGIWSNWIRQNIFLYFGRIFHHFVHYRTAEYYKALLAYTVINLIKAGSKLIQCLFELTRELIVMIIN